MKFSLFIFTLSIIVGLAACGGSGGGGGDETSGTFQVAPNAGSLVTPSPQPVGAIIDSAISGLNFVTNTNSGITDSAGIFPFVDGESITFSIGDIILPTIPVIRTITPLDIFSSTDSNNLSVINFSRLMQTLDVDGDPSNGITIDSAAHVAATGMSIQFDSPTFDTDVASLVASSGSVNTSLVGEVDARQHLLLTLNGLAEPGVYFEVYGTTNDDYTLDIGSQTLLGTSNSGTTFDMRGFDRFTIYVPPTSDKVYIDSIVYKVPEGEGGSYFADTPAIDPKITPRIANFNITNESGGGPVSLCGSDTGCDGWYLGRLPVEGSPDGLSIESIPGLPSYLSFNSEYIDASHIRVALANRLHRPLECGYTTPYPYDNPVISEFEPTNSFDDFLRVVQDCGGARRTDFVQVLAQEGYFFEGLNFLHFLAFNRYNLLTETGIGTYEGSVDGQGEAYEMLWSITNITAGPEVFPVVYVYTIFPDGNEDTSDDLIMEIYIARTGGHTTIFMKFVQALPTPLLKGYILKGESFFGN